MRQRRLLALAGVAAMAFLGGCMEMEQVTSPKAQAGQTVKRDTAAWTNEPLALGPTWKKGDRTSWEEQIKTRQLGQHEHKRIYQ